MAMLCYNFLSLGIIVDSRQISCIQIAYLLDIFDIGPDPTRSIQDR